jgi:hypothetical protein
VRLPRRRRPARGIDAEQIAFLRDQYVTGDMEAEEFERELERLLDPPSEAFYMTEGEARFCALAKAHAIVIDAD